MAKAAASMQSDPPNADDGSSLDLPLKEVEIHTVPQYEASYPALNPIDIFRSYITQQLEKMTGADANLIYTSLAWTNTLDKGDLILAVPRLRIKGPDVVQKAAEWANAFPSGPLIQKPQVEGISLRFDFKPNILTPLVLTRILDRRSEYGMNKAIGARDGANNTKVCQQKRKVVIEFSSPNIAKEFHVGHLRSTIIGAFLSNLYEALGWDVVRMNYLGDWGRQYGLLAIGFQRYGSEEALQRDPIAHLFDIYVKISAEFQPEEDAYKAARKRGEDTAKLEEQGLLGAAKEYFKRMETGDEEALSLWRRFRAISIEKYKATYERLNIEFVDYSGESKVEPAVMAEAETILRARGISEFNDGAVIIDFRKHGAKKLEVAVIRNRNGTSNYLLRDIGAAIQRFRTYKMDRMIYVIMSEQDAHVQRLFKILEIMGEPYSAYSKCVQHVTFGKIKGMSTRRGTVKFLGDVLNDMGAAMHNVMRTNETKYAKIEEPDKVADILGISSIMTQDMSGKRINAYNFELNRMLSFEGDTGPYLQYAHARLCSISRKTGYSVAELQKADFTLLKEQHAIDSIRLMASFPDTVLQTYKTLEPTTIVTYLFRLAHQLSSSYDVLQVVGAKEGPQTALARAAMYESARQVLNNGMRLLGLTPVERM